MFAIGVRTRFGAAHRLEGHPGDCARLHGHTWEVEAVFRGELTGPPGMLLDFEAASTALGLAVADLDHSCLNDLEPFASVPPTAENVAYLVYVRLEKAALVSGWDAAVDSVTVWESRDNWACYRVP